MVYLPARPSFFAGRKKSFLKLLVLLVPVIVLLLGISGFLFKINLLHLPFKQSNKGNTSVIFDNTKIFSGTARIAAYQEDALKRNKNYPGYVSLFQSVFPNYLITPKEEVRVQLEKIEKTAIANFSTDYKEEDFIIPCLDAGCQAKETDPQIEAIINKILPILAKDESARSLAINKLKSLAYYEVLSNDRKISIYNNSFKSLVSYYNSANKNLLIEEALNDFKSFISQKLPEQYKLYSEHKYYDY